MSATDKEGAERRIEQRFREMQETERKFIGELDQLKAMLLELQEEKKTWRLNGNQESLMQRTIDVVENISMVHTSLAEGMEGRIQDVNLSGVLQNKSEEMVSTHAHFRTLSTCIMVIVQKKMGGEVVGDRTVGNSPKVGGEKGEFVSSLMDLLTRPTRRLLQYQLYLDEIAKDAGKTGDTRLQSNAADWGVAFKDVAGRVNEEVRTFQRRERVQLISSRVRAVPGGISLAQPGREFLLDDGDFREFGRAGYRHLYLFNDSLLICKPGENMLGKLMHKDQDLKFKHLIPLSKVVQAAVARPAKDAASSGVEQLPFFELRDASGTTAFHHKEMKTLEEWVTTINKAREELKAPTPAYKLQPLSRTPNLEDLSINFSEYVVVASDQEEKQHNYFVF